MALSIVGRFRTGAATYNARHAERPRQAVRFFVQAGAPEAAALTLLASRRAPDVGRRLKP